LGDIQVPVTQRLSPNARIVHRTSTSVVEASDPYQLAAELARDREGRGFDSPQARPYRPLGEPQDLKVLYSALKTEIKALENPAGLGPDAHKLPYLSLSRKRAESHAASPVPSILPLRLGKETGFAKRFFKQEIAESYQRMRNVRAGKSLHTVFPQASRLIPAPKADHYSKDSLGTASDVLQGTLQHRRRFFSLYDSSAQQKYVDLPSLLGLVHRGRKMMELRSEHLPLPDRLLIGWEGLDQAKTQRKTQNKTLSESPSPLNVTFPGISAGLTAIFEEKAQFAPLGSTQKLLELVSTLSNAKSQLEKRLETDLITLKQDRPEAISLKKKHFSVTAKGTNVQTRVWDLERMRIRAEIERIGQFSSLEKELDWYKETLAAVVNENSEITPVTYFLMDTVKAVLEAGGGEQAREVVKTALYEASLRDNGGNRALMQRIAAHWAISPL